MEENNLKSYFTTYAYLCKDFRYNYDEILTTFNIFKNNIKDKDKELINVVDYFINDLSVIRDYLNNKTTTFSVQLPLKFKIIEYYVHLYHKFIIQINLNTDIKKNNTYFTDYVQFIEMTSDLLYYYINNYHDKFTILSLIYTPLYSMYFIQ